MTVINTVMAACSASGLAAWLLGWFVAGCYADKKDERDLPVGPFTITGSDPYPVCAGYCMDKVHFTAFSFLRVVTHQIFVC